MKKVILSALVSLMLVSVSYAQNSEEANRLIGVWEPSHGKAKVKIDKIGDKFYGRIVWLKTAKIQKQVNLE